MLNKKLVLGSLAGASLLLGVMVMAPTGAEAVGLMTGVCVNCHTMHNSQGGNTNLNGNGPNAQLLMFDGCIGCHARADNSTTTGRAANDPKAPQVGSAVVAARLNAGGFFGDSTDAFQHNITGLSGSAGGEGGALATAPGGTFDGSAGFDCNDCHGEAVGGHHTYGAADTNHDGTAGSSYRMLSSAPNTVLVKGQGDVNYATLSAGNSNSYNAESMNLFCADCHGLFHATENPAVKTNNDNNSNTTDWIRHPTDIAATTFGSVAGNEIPRGSTNNSGLDKAVMCISCHNPHGSANNDLLRFSYSDNVAGSGGAGVGCESCHGAK